MKIAVIIPTCREERFDIFLKEWAELFVKHDVDYYKVTDSPTVPFVEKNSEGIIRFVGDVMEGEFNDLIYNRNDGVRNLGFAAAYLDGADIFISLDDDVVPLEGNDPIQDHLDALSTRQPITWMNTTNEVFMRGFPYGVRNEAECVLSHGVWEGVADFDASTQLVGGIVNVIPRRMPVPKGVLFPMCIMNVAFKRCMMPYMYQAPMLGDINRFADIWAGIAAKRAADEHGWAVVTGYASILHNRASDPFVNLVKEARGIGMNENFGLDEYFKLFEEKSERWRNFLQGR